MAIPSYALKLYADNNKTKFPYKQHPEQDQVPVWDDLAQDYVPGAVPSHAHEASDIAASGATTGQVLEWNGTAWVPVTLAKPNHIKSLTILTPAGSNEGTLFFTDTAITITQISHHVSGASTPTVPWTVRYAADRTAAGTEVITGGLSTTATTTPTQTTSFTAPTIPADSVVWIEIGTVSGTVTEFNLTIEYTED